MIEDNKPVDFADLKVSQLREEIDLYAKAGIVPAEGTDLELKAEIVYWLEQTREAHGVPHVITAEDLELPENKLPMAKAELKEGDVVLLPLLSESPLKPFIANTEVTTTDGVIHSANEVVMLDPESEETKSWIEGGMIAPYVENVEVTPSEPAADTLVAPLPDRLIYQGKLVRSHNDKIINGKAYVEIHMDTESAVVPKEEFNSVVTIARSND